MTRPAFASGWLPGALAALDPVLLFLADENFNNDVVRGLLRRQPNLDIVRVQDVGLSGADDPRVLAWAAHTNRILLTHDVSTITRFAIERVAAGQPMPGVVEVTRLLPVGRVIEDLLLLAETSLDGEWNGLVLYLPLR